MTDPRPMPTIASVERVAQHRNGKGAEPYLSIFCTSIAGLPMHALLFAEPGRVAVFNLRDPEQRLCGGTYEHDLRTIAAEVGLSFDNRDPLTRVREIAASVLTDVVCTRDAAAPEHKAKLRAIGRHLERAVGQIDRAIERAEK